MVAGIYSGGRDRESLSESTPTEPLGSRGDAPGGIGHIADRSRRSRAPHLTTTTQLSRPPPHPIPSCVSVDDRRPLHQDELSGQLTWESNRVERDVMWGDRYRQLSGTRWKDKRAYPPVSSVGPRRVNAAVEEYDLHSTHSAELTKQMLAVL